jgi:MerR family mercuric resistance operon transcriptional regulator
LASHHLADIRERIAGLRRVGRVLAGLAHLCAKGEPSGCPLLEALACSTASADDQGQRNKTREIFELPKLCF